MTHRKGETATFNKIEKAKPGRYLVIVGKKSVHAVRLKKRAKK